MTENFHRFAQAVQQRVTQLSKHELFVVDGIDLFTSYLLAFPEGTNPIFRERTVHDCSCCKNFIRNMGGAVAIIDGKKQSIWKAEALPHPYDTVADAMDQLVQQLPIKGVYRTKEKRFGAENTYDSELRRWEHFHGEVARRHQTPTPAEARGELNTTAQVLQRGLEELHAEALETVLDLIESNTLYRGTEFKRSVQEFASLQRAYRQAENPDLHIWSSLNSSAARFRNTVIGTLVQDLSEGMDLERAVRSFESKVAPTNYKRPKALITPKMVDAALKTLEDLGLQDAVERRFAQIADVSVNDVLFVDNSVRGQMRDGLRSALMEAAKEQRVDAKDATRISIDDFVRHIVPTARTIEILVKNQHEGNFVSLTAPAHPSTGRLFKWKNDFAWSYVGEVADSIKQRVKKAGGNTNAVLRVSLAWSNYDDLDLHAHCPGNEHIYFQNKAGILDVDMNAGSGNTREPVENLSWTRPRDGTYTIFVYQFAKRETSNVGFSLEIECNGQVKQFSHPRPLSDKEQVNCISFKMQKGMLSGLKMLSSNLNGGDLSTMRWGVKTETFVPVSTLMASPNHWEGAGEIGNKHWFFILKGCQNPEAARGIYNEFLRGDLEPHRKVFEVLGAKTKCQPTSDQLSGLGFTSARKDEVTAKVTTSTSTRTYNIAF